MPDSEKKIMHDIMVAATKAGHRLFRNNVGRALTIDGRVITFGLCVGSADLIGWSRRGRFVAIECKTIIGRASPEQLAFIAAVQTSGGLAGIARSVDDALALIGDG